MNKITDESEIGFDFNTNTQACILSLTMLENTLNKWLFWYYCENSYLTLVMENSEKSWKRSWKGVEFWKIERVWTMWNLIWRTATWRKTIVCKVCWILKFHPFYFSGLVQFEWAHFKCPLYLGKGYIDLNGNKSAKKPHKKQGNEAS